ncbi:hypothetical protein [Aliivibrio fischeri]|uniref:hypothetical protein n=1 Tax=Aliivibrio fischeri TaxID=668 RepID=UPI0007C44EC4|nr:hypothetical protein [Aliivibrio fischeri]
MSNDKNQTPKCRKCKGTPCTYKEITHGVNIYNLTEGKFTSTNGSGLSYCDANIQWEMGDSDPTGQFIATCGGCGTEWTLDGKRYIHELIEVHGHINIHKNE